MVGYRCPGNKCTAPKIYEPGEYEEKVRLWSEPNDWPNGVVPIEGDDVHVESTWNMVFDMNPSPIYKFIRVNGNLTFSPDKDT